MKMVDEKLKKLSRIKEDIKDELINKGAEPDNNIRNYGAVIRSMSGGITNTVSASITPPDAE